MEELYTLQNRGYCLGFYDGHLTNISQNYEYTRTLGDWLFAGSIVEWDGDDAIFEIRNYIDSNEEFEFLVPGSLDVIKLKMSDFEELFPELTLETDDIIMELAIKKDYSQIRDLDKRKEEFIKDLHDFIDEFSQTPESREFMAFFD